MNRRRFLQGVAALAAPGLRFDGRSVTLDGREHALTDILVPSLAPLHGEAEAGADFAAAALKEIVARGAILNAAEKSVDRWGRAEGAIGWRTHDGRETTLQEMLTAEGAARVAPESGDHDLIERCYAAEARARAERLGLWSLDAWRVRNASTGEPARGYQIYRGVIMRAAERDGRVYFNFGADFRTDVTATALRRDFRRWAGKPAADSFAGREVEVRGLVLWINGPSIEIRHELQLRVA